MTTVKTYTGACHCRVVTFRFKSEEITTGNRCNCSICIRKGVVMSPTYIRADDFEELTGNDSLTLYQFGDRDVKHCFCKVCGVHPFNVIAGVPADYQGPARVGDRRVNLGCVDDLDVFSLEIGLIDGRSY